MAERKSKSKSRRKSKSPYCTPPASKRALESLFASPDDASHSFLAASLSPDRALTFLQSARDRDVPVRFGKWSGAEDAYLAQLVALFSDGLLADVDAKTTLRAWLALMLNCCPMRISKKQMHGRGFAGKTKFRRSARAERMPQDKHQQLCAHVEALRSGFVRAWACEEVERRSASLDSVDEWVARLQPLVPTPQLAKPLRDEPKSDNFKPKLKPKLNVKLKPIVELEPAPIPVPTPAASALVAPSYFDEPVSLGDWLMGHGQSASHAGEPKYGYTFCEDEVQFSVHVGDQQNGVSMTRRSSRVVIDFGAPSCWHTGEEPKRTSVCDFVPWSDNDLVEEGALLPDPGVLSWDDACPTSAPYTTYSPPLNLL
ncbi:hypothetical protein PF008_g356 [Phytophthora fragariae]|uniref:Uncharacterized protein n=1 Tax=Phytophthora fragariae TaxID=53985 RepID=A0A6G0SN96_9STRA|nr:hypothetical protein PF008_g356 [Phytophthora fragariae]